MTGGKKGAGAARRGKRPAAAPRIDDEAFRLSPHVRPARYRVHIEPDLEAGTFRGTVSIEARLARPVDRIELHGVDFSIEHAEVAAGRLTQAARIIAHSRRETIEMVVPERLKPGAARIGLRFAGKLQKALRGFYGAACDGRRYGFTQLEATDARRFFPCFDEPAMKARFSFAVTTDERNAVISNSPIERVEGLPGGRKTVHFAPTPPLSTYLCALAVGELESSEEVMVGRTPVRVWHVPGKGHLAHFGLEAARESLARLEKYFGLPYPYAKLDLVAVPDFEAGAMENAGAVFFRETLLLADPDTITLAEKKRVAEVIAHELAHMWYGDLVTMKWWNDLWLNEAFATWMAFRVVDEWRPEWRMWNNFEHHRATALSLDALENTHPIYCEVANPAQATQNFDAITYEKGAAVVRMVEHYLGAAAFRAGVRKYIRAHREGNAEAADLWRALEAASGQRLNRVVRAWIEQPGFPLVRAAMAERGGRGVLDVRQQRFFANPKIRPGRQRWPVPLVIKVNGGSSPRLVRHMMTGARAGVALGPAKRIDSYYVNAAEGGFYRPLHDEDNLAALRKSLPAALGPVERMGIVGHEWAALRAGHAAADGFLDLVAACGAEEDYDVLDAVAGPVRFMEDQLIDDGDGETRTRLHSWLRARFEPAWKQLDWDADPDEPDGVRLRRASILRLVGEVAEHPLVAAGAQARFLRYVAHRGTVEPNLADSLVAIVARDGNPEHYATFLEVVKHAKTPQERRRFLLALGDFRRGELVERTLSMLVTDQVPTQDVGLLLVRLLGNRAARVRAWDFMKDAWESLSRRLPPMMVSRVVDATPALKTKAFKRDVAAFFRAHPVPTAERALRQALERFDLNQEFRRRAGNQVRRWLAENA